MARLEQYEMGRANGNKATLKQANAKYKTHEKVIRSLLTGGAPAVEYSELLRRGLELLTVRQEGIGGVAKDVLFMIERHGELDSDQLVSSYIHMLINRLFVSNPNRCELILYTILNRHYFADLKRS